MGRRSVRWATTVLLWSIGLATPSFSAAQDAERLEVIVHAPKAVTFERVLAAWTAEGLLVEQANADAGTLQSPLVKRGGVLLSFRSRHRAVVLSMGDSSKVVFSGGFISDSFRDPSMGEGKETPLSSGMKRDLGKEWQRLKRLAAALDSTSAAGAR